MDEFVPEFAAKWLDRYKGSEPFFLQIGIPGPHPPYDPAQDYIDKYSDRDLPEAIRDQQAIDRQPSAFKKLRAQHMAVDHDADVHLENPTKEQLRHRQRETRVTQEPHRHRVSRYVATSLQTCQRG